MDWLDDADRFGAIVADVDCDSLLNLPFVALRSNGQDRRISNNGPSAEATIPLQVACVD